MLNLASSFRFEYDEKGERIRVAKEPLVDQNQITIFWKYAGLKPKTFKSPKFNTWKYLILTAHADEPQRGSPFFLL